MSIRPFSAILLAHEAPDFANLQQNWFSSEPIPKSARHKFVILGRFDQLIINLSDDPAVLLPAASNITNARAATSSTYIGRVVAPGDFEPTKWAESYPILGLCSVRFARRILAATDSFEFLNDFLARRLAGQDIRYTVVSATGWEDALVLFFARNFNIITTAVGQLRSMRLADLDLAHPVNAEDGFTHACLTTCTLPAFCCQWQREWTKKDTKALLKRIDAHEKLNWAVRLELHPGHWQGCAADLKRRCEAEGLGDLLFRSTFGQTDLRISDAGGEASTHGGLMRFILDVLFKAGEARTVIRSAETHLHPVVEDYQEDPNAGAETDIRPPDNPLPPKPRPPVLAPEIREKLRLVAVPPHTLSVLEEMLNRVQGISDDPMHGEEFETLKQLRNAFTKAVERMPCPISERESRILQRDISEWQMLLDRCLGDRFRGPYPAGDSMMMKLATYQGAHHRFLVVMDAIARSAYEMVRGTILQHLPDCVLPETALATFIGNSPSAYATAHTIDSLGCGFTDVPATLVCRLRDTHLLFHETGHHVVRAFFASQQKLGFSPYVHDPVRGLGSQARDYLEDIGLSGQDIHTLNACWKRPGVLREVREILADYFSCCLCYPQDIRSHKNASLLTLENFFRGGSELFMRSVQTEFRLRSGAIEALQSKLDGKIEDAEEEYFREIVERGMDVIKAGGGTFIDFETYKHRSEEIQHAVRALDLLCQVPEIKALLRGFDTCASMAAFPGEEVSRSLLHDLRQFLADPKPPALEAKPSALEANFAFLDKLWFNLLRRSSAEEYGGSK